MSKGRLQMSEEPVLNRGFQPLKVYVAHVHTGDRASLRALVAQLEDLGVAGFLTGDHLFMRSFTQGVEHLEPAGDPFTTLAAVGALSDGLELGTLVANVGFSHPALVLRHFAQLAALYGGQRILAGLGAGWNRQEFEALGGPMPPLAERLDHLESSIKLARAWFDDGVADLSAPTVVARDLPMAPKPATSPRLMLGGGSEQVLALAGRYADHIDLHPLISRPETRRQGGSDDVARFLATTVDMALRAVESLETFERDAGRPVGTTVRSMWMGLIEFCEPGQRDAAEADLLASHGLSPRDLTECPYALVGDAQQMASLITERRRVLGLDAIVMQPGEQLQRFMTEVVPLLGESTVPTTPPLVNQD